MKQPTSPNPHSSPLLLCSVWKLPASPWSPQKWRHPSKMKQHLKIQSGSAIFGPGVASFRAVSLDIEKLAIFKSRKCFISNEKLATQKMTIWLPTKLKQTTKGQYQLPNSEQPSLLDLSSVYWVCSLEATLNWVICWTVDTCTLYCIKIKIYNCDIIV